MKQSAIVNGYIRAIANAEQDSTNPLQTRLSLILTDFEPNGNKQGIPRSEIENIIRTAELQPLKINFNGDGFSGHTGAFPIGPIVNVHEGVDNSRPVLLGDAIIWNQIYPQVAEHLKNAFVDGIGTSWEIFYEDEEIDDNNVSWLHGCVYSGQCVVEVPAYGPNRTRILAIAEELTKETEEVESMTLKSESAAEDNMDTTRTQLLETQDLLFKLWEGVDTLFNKTFEIEAASVEKDIGKIAATFAEKIGKLADKINKLSTSSAELETENKTLKEEKEAIARAELVKTRKTALSELGIDVEDTVRLNRYIDMTETDFNEYVKDLKSVKGIKTSTAEQKEPIIPEPLSTTEVTTNEIVAALMTELQIK